MKYKLGKNSATILIVAIIAISLIAASLIFLNSQNTYVLLFVFAFALNLIPFAGPSNLLIASTFAIGLVNPDPATLLLIGFLVALGAALAKGIHYMITFFVSGHLSEKRRQRLDTDAAKVKRWAFPLLFIVAATPIPDEPVIIPLGLMKYSPAKFFTAYFLGKLSIAVAGAFLGNVAEKTFSGWLSPEAMIVISIVLTVVITVLMFKVDFGKLAERFLKKKPMLSKEKTKYLSQNAIQTIHMPTQRRYPLKAKEAKQIVEEASKTLKLDVDAVLGGKENVEVVESDVGSIYLILGKPVLFKFGNRVLPTLLFSEYIAGAPKIIVDMGAIPYVCKGATVMAPGIVRVEGEFKSGDLVVVADMKHGKALAIGESLMDSETAKVTKKGPVVKTLHYVSDKIWDYIKTITG